MATDTPVRVVLSTREVAALLTAAQPDDVRPPAGTAGRRMDASLASAVDALGSALQEVRRG